MEKGHWGFGVPHYGILQTKSSGFGVGEVFGFRTANLSFFKRSKDPDRLASPRLIPGSFTGVGGNYSTLNPKP